MQGLAPGTVMTISEEGNYQAAVNGHTTRIDLHRLRFSQIPTLSGNSRKRNEKRVD